MPTADDTATPRDDIGGGHLPQRKVVASTVGAAIGTILTWLLDLAISADIPTGIEGAIAVLCTFLLGYLVPEGIE